MADTPTVIMTIVVIMISLLLVHQGGILADIGIDLMFSLVFVYIISNIDWLWTALGLQALIDPLSPARQALRPDTPLPEDHDGDTEPLLQEWFAEHGQALLNDTSDDTLDDGDSYSDDEDDYDSGLEDESLLSGTTAVDSDADDSGYESASLSDDGDDNSFGSDSDGD
ncbi:hypothetical protein ACQKWADRAFT_330742 [Trichoderma austrokoningii]